MAPHDGPEPPAPTPATGPVISVDRDTKEGVDLLRRRLVLFWGVVEIICLALFLPAQILGITALQRRWPAQLSHPGTLAQLGSLLVVGAIWFVCRYTRQPRQRLELLDAAAAVSFCLGGALMTYFAPGAALPVLDVGGPVSATWPMGMLSGMVAIFAILIMRAALVPSTPLRTALVAVVASLPLVVALLIQRREGTPAATSFAVLSILVSVAFIPFPTVISAVIYRLQRQAHQAQQLGQYTLEARIGEGGMGVVYRARHALLRRPTAIKLLPPERAGAQGLARFQREVQQTSRLSHPNTVAIYDYGHTADGVFYYAMEYLDGLSLEELVVHDGPQPPGRVVHMLRQACGALAEAHAAGLVHRDIKPANLHLCSRGGLADHLKVLDFGLVKDIDPERGDANLSTAQSFLGTPLYIAPETISRPESIDGRADLYALGAVAYYLLTGSPPFQAATLLEICSQHLHLKPDAPSLRLGRDLPAALERLVLRCLAKSPDERPASAAELARALAACPGVWSWTEEDAARWWQKRAPAVLEVCARRRRSQSSASGERTVAVDLEDRQPPPAGAG
jgi:hypothetical protein